MADDIPVILHFGKFKGMDIEDVPSDYLNYLLESDWFEKQYLSLIDPIEKEMKFRSTFNTHFYGEAKG
jgi:uncharacterized protein (DUF3820 family)